MPQQLQKQLWQFYLEKVIHSVQTHLDSDFDEPDQIIYF